MEFSRLFLPQEALDTWLTDGLVDITQDELAIPALGLTCHLVTALHFVDEVAGGGDEAGLVGRVQDLEQLEALGGEHCSDSVILGDNAYQVVEGFAARITTHGAPNGSFDASSADPALKALAAQLLDS